MLPMTPPPLLLLLFAVSNPLPPASEMSCQAWTGLSFVCQGDNRSGVTTSKRENRGRGGVKVECTGAVVGEAPPVETSVEV